MRNRISRGFVATCEETETCSLWLSYWCEENCQFNHKLHVSVVQHFDYFFLNISSFDFDHPIQNRRL